MDCIVRPETSCSTSRSLLVPGVGCSTSCCIWLDGALRHPAAAPVLYGIIKYTSYRCEMVYSQRSEESAAIDYNKKCIISQESGTLDPSELVIGTHNSATIVKEGNVKHYPTNSSSGEDFHTQFGSGRLKFLKHSAREGHSRVEESARKK